MDKATAPEGTDLVGPFTVEASGTNGYRIVGGDGTVAIWVTGQGNALCVAALLNLAHSQNLLN